MPRVLLIGVTGYLLALLVTVPATLLVDQVIPRLGVGERIVLTNPAGTFWSGESTLIVSDVRLGRLRWTVAPSELFSARGAVKLELQTDEGTASGTLGVALGGAIHLSGVTGHLSRKVLQAFNLLRSLPVVPSGALLLNIETLELMDGAPKSANGVVLWQQAGVESPQRLQFGELRLTLVTGDDGHIEGKIEDGGGVLRAQGTVLLKPDRSYTLLLTLSGRAGADPNLAQAITFVGQPDGKGGRRVVLNGVLN